MDLDDVELPPELLPVAAAVHGHNARVQIRDVMINYFAGLPN